MEQTSVLAENLRARMEAEGMNQKSLALAAGVNVTYVRDILQGKSLNPRHEHLHKVASALGCDLTELTTGTYQPPSTENSAHKRQVGDNLRLAIEALGLKQNKVAADFDISPSKLGNWLRGDNYPDPWFVIRFCARYGITTDWIYRKDIAGVAARVADDLWAAAKASEAVPAEQADQANGSKKRPKARKTDLKQNSEKVFP